jgi:hypothetical protein
VPVLEKLGASTAGVRAPAVESTGEVVATEVVTHRKYYGKPGGKVTSNKINIRENDIIVNETIIIKNF